MGKNPRDMGIWQAYTVERERVVDSLQELVGLSPPLAKMDISCQLGHKEKVFDLYTERIDVECLRLL